MNDHMQLSETKNYEKIIIVSLKIDIFKCILRMNP